MPALEHIVASSVKVENPQRADCDVVVVTAHKAKGLEFDSVRIAGDFYGPDNAPPAISGTRYDDEHLRLAYVAVTRARKHLDLGGLWWIEHPRAERLAMEHAAQQAQTAQTGEKTQTNKKRS